MSSGKYGGLRGCATAVARTDPARELCRGVHQIPNPPDPPPAPAPAAGPAPTAYPAPEAETSRPRVSVVVPVYNGEARLPGALAQLSAWLDAQPWPSELILVDDCSREPAAAVLAAFAASRNRTTVIRNERNMGKGAAIARGMRVARGTLRVFTDADLAYPPSEIGKIVADLESGADVAIACRVLPGSRYLMSPSFFHYLYTRHLMSRAFNLLVRATLLRDVRDSQAGLKGFTQSAADTVFPRLTIPRFGFDVEALFIAQLHGLTVRQTAVHFRYDEEPTTVRFARAGAQMAADLIQVRVNHLRGRYR